MLPKVHTPTPRPGEIQSLAPDGRAPERTPERPPAFSSLTSPAGGPWVPSAADRATVAHLCREALYAADQPAALRAVAQHALLVLRYLADDAVCEALTVKPPGSVPAERIAALYRTLAQAGPQPDLPVSTRDLLLRENLDEEAAIGRAFKEDLWAHLRPLARNLAVFFAAAPRVSRKVRDHLRQAVSVEAGWPECAELVECGLTPLSVFYATTNVADLAERLGLRDRPVRLVRVRGAMTWRHPAQEFSHRVTREVLQVNRCSEQAAETLVDWLIEVAVERPLVFAGYRATRAEAGRGGVDLVADEEYSGLSFGDRWRYHDATRWVSADSGTETAVAR